jgi:hypothetical protein
MYLHTYKITIFVENKLLKMGKTYKTFDRVPNICRPMMSVVRKNLSEKLVRKNFQIFFPFLWPKKIIEKMPKKLFCPFFGQKKIFSKKT